MLRLVRWLAATNRWPTFYYERFVLLTAVEIPALGLITWASPSLATWVSGLLGLVGAVLSQTARSVASRRAEKAAVLGIESVTVSCEAADERRAIWQQRLTTLSPFVGAAAAWGTSGINRAVIVGFFCAVARNLWVDAYGAWRSFYVANKGVQS
jgi:hypothetical protein